MIGGRETNRRRGRRRQREFRKEATQMEAIVWGDHKRG